MDTNDKASLPEIRTVGDFIELACKLAQCYLPSTPVEFKRNCVSDEYLIAQAKKDIKDIHFGPALVLMHSKGVHIEMQEEGQ